MTFPERPRRLAARRVGPSSPGAADVDVVFDVMIHDIHLIQALLGEEPTEIDVTGRPVVSPVTDTARARLTFPGGCIATLLASRAAPARQRVYRVRGDSAVMTADLVEQCVTVRGVAPSRTPAVGRRDLLEEQILAFARAVYGRATDAVQAPAVLGAMLTAQRIS